MTKYTLGIDTGGTYTDAVIVDSEQHTIIAGAKALTTRGDLAIGVTEALAGVLLEAGPSFDATAISYVSLSTTLATNALVQGQGDDVVTFLIGFDDGMAQRTNIMEAAATTTIVRVDGGHTYAGEEQRALDIAAVKTALENQAGRARAYAVAAHYSVRNSSHELQVKELIEATTGRPVTISSDLSEALDAPRRALTATLNARIISLISALETAVQDSMLQHGIKAPIMMVKGDGSLVPAQSAVLKPIETILSGPAASVIGSRFLSGMSDFVIVDIGGTTSDVATVRNGWPKLEESGSVVGGFRTLVRAIDMQTIGLGGDSEVMMDSRGGVTLDNHRVVPISLLGHKWPRVIAELQQALSASSGMLGAFRYGILPEGAGGVVAAEDLSAKDQQFLSQFAHGEPMLLRELITGSADIARVVRLVGGGFLQVSGFTPSDAAHVLGLQCQWSTVAAVAACELMGRANGLVIGVDTTQQLENLAREIHSELARKSSWLLLEQLTGKSFSANNALVQSMTDGTARLGNLGLEIRPLLPVVAVGGPAAVFFPEVGQRLNATVTIPDRSEVANAIGAAVGMIKVRVVIEVTKTNEGYLVHHDDSPRFVEASLAALELAKEIASREAQYGARKLGGHEVDIDLEVSRVDVPEMDENVSLIAATITAQAVSQPRALSPDDDGLY